MLRNSGKRPRVEKNDENMVPDFDPTRPPLSTITGAVVNTGSAGSDVIPGRKKVERTPSKKRQFKGQESAVQRTPEKTGLLVKNRFGWSGLKNEFESTGSENCDEVAELPPLGRGGSCFGFGTPKTKRIVGKGTSDGGSVESTPSKSVSRVASTGLGWSGAAAGVGPRPGSFSAAARRLPMASSPSTVVNSVEVPHFELTGNPAFWMQHNVQVVIRVRPLNGTEISLQGYKRCLKQEDSHRISWIGQPEGRFVFDQVACETINQESLFRVMGQPMVENCMSGYNSCVFAYGQTGSGKTYTMLGDLDNLEVRPSHHRGIIPRMFEFLFARIRVEEECRKDEKLKYNCKCSFLEIYNEQITDLLDPSSANLILREDAQKGIYVENLTEFVVENTKDIVKLLVQGAANRKMAATNMNRESSRSHGVFTCVIESTWEKDSVTNLRFARLNLVDLAGSERQKMSGAEGERLKEAANINKSLSTLGHVIMVLVDMAHGKLRHVPYRDSRLTFLLQDSLGGNSKTMIIANVSPSVSCSSETLSTLRFAQRAKFIQNNAFVNEDASGDVMALQRQIRLLKEEISMLRHQNVSRSLSFQTIPLNDFDAKTCEASDVADLPEDNDKVSNNWHKREVSDSFGVSRHQLKSLEGTLVGALRREKAAEITIKQFEAENQKLDQLVHQREDEIQCMKMMLKFREDKIQRMEALVNGLVSGDSYTLEESSSLAKEVKLLQDRADRNPEVTRFALENIRLLEKIRRFQDFYQEGERELLLSEVSNLRDQLVQVLERKTQLDMHPTWKKGHVDDTLGSSGYSPTENDCLRIELKKTYEELEDCRNNLKSCLEINERLTREMDDIHSKLNITKPDSNNLFVPGELVDMETMNREKTMDIKDDITMQFAEKIVDLQLELDILKLILGEVKLYHSDAEDKALHVSKNLATAEEKISLLNEKNEDAKVALKAAEAVIEALESQQVLSINEMEELRTKYSASVDLLIKQDMEINFLRPKLGVHTNCQDLKKEQIEPSECDPPLEMKVNKLQASLDKARLLSLRYQSDHDAKILHEQEMDEIREQVEAETTEVIVCLQEEVHTLQKQLCDSKIGETEARESLVVVEKEFKIAQERLYFLTQDNERFMELLEEKDRERRSLTEEWETFAHEIGHVLSLVNFDLEAVSFEIDSNENGLPYKAWISEKVSTIVGTMSEKDSLIEELQKSLVEAQNIRCDLEWKLRSLQEATLSITEEQQKKIIGKDREIFHLSSQLSDKESIMSELEGRTKQIEDQLKKAELHATVAFLTVNRISDINSVYLEELNDKRLRVIELEGINLQNNAFMQEQISRSASSDELIQLLRSQLIDSERNVVELKAKLDEKQEHIFGMQIQLEKVKKDLDVMKCSSDLLEVGKKLSEFNLEMNTLQTCMNGYNDGERKFLKELIPGTHAVDSANNVPVDQTKCDPYKCISKGDCNGFYDVGTNHLSISATGDNNTSNWCSGKAYFCGQHELIISESVEDVETTILLLWKEIQFAFQCLGGLQAQMSKILDEETEIKQYNVHSKMKIEALTVEVRRIEMEMTHKEEIVESRLSELCHKMKILEGKVEESAKALDKAKMDFMLEISVASRHAAEKDFEASILHSQFEEALGKINQYDIQRQMCIQDLMVEVHSIKVEMIHKESALESRLKDLHHEMQLLKGKTEYSIKVLNETKMDLMIEVGESTRLAAEKDFEALVLLSQFKETQGVIVEANAIFNSFMLINESARLEVQNHLRTEKVLVDERDRLREEVCRLDSVLEMAKQGYDLLEKKVQTNMTDLEVIATSVQSMFTQLQTSFMQEMESLSCYIDNLKSEFFHLISMERISLENLSTEIIGKDCAASVLLLCQNGMFLEKIAALSDDARSLHCRLLDLNAHIPDLSEQHKNEKEATEMFVLKGRLLVDINNSLNYIAINESEAADLKSMLYIIEKKLLESDKEELLLARFIALTNELSVVTKELDDNDSITMSRSFSDLDKLVLYLAVKGKNDDLKWKTLQIAQFKSQIEALDSSIENMQSEKLLSLFEGELAKQMLTELEIELSMLRKQSNDAHMQLDLSSHESHRLMKELKKRSEEQLQMEMKLKDLELDFHDQAIKELELSDQIKLQQTALKGKVKEFDDLLDRFIVLAGEHSTLSNDLKEASDKNSKLSMKIHLLENENVKISGEHLALKAHLEDIMLLKNLEVKEKDDQIRRFEKDVIEMKIFLDQQTNFLCTVQNDLDKIREERSHFDSEIFILKEHLEMASKLAEEKEAIALEAQQIAESRKTIVEEKEEEVKLLEKSIEELECTINVLQNKVEIVKDEAERQRLQREELEIEVRAVKHQLLEVKRCDVENNLDGVPGYCKVQGHEPKKMESKVQLLEKDIKDKNEEIGRYQEHILELNMHAEAQAQQNAQKIMELETMVDKLKSEPINGLGSTASRCERNAVKTRGSSSPFKCIGLGFAQVNSDKEEELNSGRLRIQELESLNANHRKEIFSLNTRLAASESMTHDVIRDLLGVKLDIAKYASLVDHQQLQKIMDSPCLQHEDSLDKVIKEHETAKMKKQLNEFIEERQGWLDELNRRHSEMVATKVSLEKLRQHDQFLTTENEVLKADTMRHKKMVMQLEDEIKKLHSQQNLQYRINHHVKIKEENNILKIQKQDLATKLQKSEEVLSCVRAELAAYRSSIGMKLYDDTDEEQRLRDKLAYSEK